jgi:hypothetical protein
MKSRPLLTTILLLALITLAFSLAGCQSQPATAPAPKQATITVTFDLGGGGGSGFAAIIYGQEVSTGKTFKVLYPAGSHGLVVQPTSPPVTLTVDAPGTYVFYANLNEAPDDYHFGYNGCQLGGDCSSRTLKVLDVVPGGMYKIYITERFDIVPTPGTPVAQPWVR